MSDVDISSPQVELLVRRENMNQSKIFTLLITGLLGIALVFMGLDLLYRLSPNWDGEPVCVDAYICLLPGLGFPSD